MPVCIECPEVITVCRKNRLHGCCLIFFGLGLILGHCLESWFFCCCGGIGLIIFGIIVSKKR